MTQLDKLKVNLNEVGDARNYANSMEKEYAGIAGTSGNKLQLARNRVTAMTIVLGERLLPLVLKGAEWIGNLADRVSAWSKANPELSRSLLYIATSLLALKVGIGAGAFAIGTLLRVFSGLLGVLTYVGPVLRGAVGAFRLLFGPVSWLVRMGMLAIGAIATITGLPAIAVAAIAAALIGASVLVYRNWDRIKAAFNQGVAFFQSLVPRFKSIGAMMLQGLLSALNPLTLVQHVLKLGKAAITAIKAVLGIKSPSRVFATIGDHMMGGLNMGLDRSVDGPLKRIRTAGKDFTAAMAVGAAVPVAAAPAIAATQPLKIAQVPRLSVDAQRAGASRAPAASAPLAGDLHFHIQSSAGTDPQALARQIAAAVSAELDRLKRADKAARDSRYTDEDA